MARVSLHREVGRRAATQRRGILRAGRRTATAPRGVARARTVDRSEGSAWGNVPSASRSSGRWWPWPCCSGSGWPRSPVRARPRPPRRPARATSPNASGGPAPASAPAPTAVADALADRRAHPHGHADRGPGPRPGRHPDADPAPDAEPDPRPDERPADRRDRPVHRRRATPDRGDDRRPLAGPAAVRPAQRRHRVARPGRGRHPALHGHLPESKLPTAIGPVRSARSYYVAWAAELKALYAHAGGSPQALATLRSKGRGKYVWNAEVVPLGRPLLPPLAGPLLAAQRVHGRQDPAQARPGVLGAKDGKVTTVLRTFLPDAPDVSRPYGGRIRVTYRANTVVYRYTTTRPTRIGARSASRAPRSTPADGERIAPKNVIVMVVRFATTGDQQAPPGGRPHRLRQGLDLDQRPDHRGHAGRRPGTTKPTRFYDRAGNRLER